MWAIMAVMFIAIFFDFDPPKSFPLRHAARAFGQQLGKLIDVNVKATRATGIISGVVDSFRENQNALKQYGVHMVRKLLESGLGPEEIGKPSIVVVVPMLNFVSAYSQILPVATAMIPNQSQVVSFAITRISDTH